MDKSLILEEYTPDAFSKACCEVMRLADELSENSGGVFTARQIFEEILSSIEYAEDAHS